MDMQDLRAFLAVAEERHFSRAAQRLHISQPPLSQRIGSLERKLGVRLFERGRGGVSLTAAGQALLPQARVVLQQLARAEELARRAGRGESGQLSIGFAGSMPFSETLPRLLRDYRQAWPGVRLSLREHSSNEQVEQLLHHGLDLGFIRPTRHGAEHALQTRVLQREALFVALHREHPLALGEPLGLRELREQPFILYSQQFGSGLREQILDLCAGAGFSPRVVQEVHEMPTLICLVSAGIGVGLVAASMQRASVPNVRYVALADAGATSDVVLAWRSTDSSPALHNFLALAFGAPAPAAAGAQGR
jgi:DNA-binding transcriptional LysR family regulator